MSLETHNACLLEVRDLAVEYAVGEGSLAAVNGVTFEMRAGEVLGVLGESGSGKTTLGLALLRLLPPGGRIVRGSIRFRNRELLAFDENELQRFRGSKVSMIFQEPGSALNPFLRAMDQVQEVIRAHRPWSRQRRREAALEVLGEVQLNKDSRLLSAYPHQLSGGERQRLVIAQALACRPALLIADEPSASLDALLQLEWLELMKQLRDRLGLALLLITHDPAILTAFADRVLIVYAGRIVEQARFDQIVRQPLHPYTQALLRCIPPAPGTDGAKKRLPAIAAARSSQLSATPACPFEPHCPDRLPRCFHEEPPEAVTDDQRRVRCWKYGG